jgi:hypothetical protein
MYKHFLSRKKLGISELGRLNDVHLRRVRNVFLFYMQQQ